jgi:hypothetical protein
LGLQICLVGISSTGNQKNQSQKRKKTGEFHRPNYKSFAQDVHKNVHRLWVLGLFLV